jgi:molybdopterin-binding protein
MNGSGSPFLLASRAEIESKTSAISVGIFRSAFCGFDQGGFSMKISARNILKGKIVDVTKGATTAHVRIDIGGTVVTASITNAAADELKLKSGQDAYAVIKASDVMVAVD